MLLDRKWNLYSHEASAPADLFAVVLCDDSSSRTVSETRALSLPILGTRGWVLSTWVSSRQR